MVIGEPARPVSLPAAVATPRNNFRGAATAASSITRDVKARGGAHKDHLAVRASRQAAVAAASTTFIGTCPAIGRLARARH
ncbi:hypothetical protein NicSoilB8_19150 [Arthrobacter sp. NicSoilB8]|nr:hypothetical protein NicSoilB8_19150 [Arthrobacter sp. NicSoilB8]